MLEPVLSALTIKLAFTNSGIFYNPVMIVVKASISGAIEMSKVTVETLRNPFNTSVSKISAST